MSDNGQIDNQSSEKQEPSGNKPEEDASSNKFDHNGDRLLTFNVGKEEFALALSSVKEVIAIPEFTKVPNAASYLMGLINLRGQVISTIDIAKIFNIEKVETGERAVIICDHFGDPIGLAVDSVNRVVITAEGETDSELPKEGQRNTRYLSGVFRQGENLTVIVDCEKLCNFVQGKKEAA